MFERLTDDDRGQVGIGTLIIFIALVLVAAVAAGVLVNTAGELQSRASDTGDDAQAQVSNQIDVVSATGEDGSDGNIETVTLVVKKSPGSDPINVSEATIQYTSATDSETLTVTGSSVALQDETGTAIDPLTGDQVLDDTSERKKLEITLPTALDEGATAELQIVDQSGASTVYGVNVPDVLSETYVAV